MFFPLSDSEKNQSIEPLNSLSKEALWNILIGFYFPSALLIHEHSDQIIQQKKKN